MVGHVESTRILCSVLIVNEAHHLLLLVIDDVPCSMIVNVMNSLKLVEHYLLKNSRELF